MNRQFPVAALVLVVSSYALAQDEKVLSGKDDTDFAQALVENDYPDLAMKLLGVIDKKGGVAGADAKAAIAKIKLDIVQNEARKVDDPLKRKELLVGVLRDKEKFIDGEFKGTRAAEDCRNTLSDLYNVIAETFAAAIKREKDERVLDTIRSEGDGIFLKAEESIQKRIDELKAIEDKTEEDNGKLMAAQYNRARTLYFHALLYSPGSEKRLALCKRSLDEYGEFDLEWNSNDPATTPFIVYYSLIDTGNCLREIGKPEDAISQGYDKVIDLRESWGPRGKDGKFPIPAGNRDMTDLICFATLQKMLVHKDGKKLDKAIEVGKDYFASLPSPFDASSSMALARELGDVQISANDAEGAVKTGKMMIKEDEAGIGGPLGRDLLERAGAGGVSWTDKLRTADSKLGSNEYEKALSICRQVMADVAGTPDEQEGGCQSLVFIGYTYQKRGWFEEAALAYDTAVERYPGAKGASEACSRAIDCYADASRVGRRKRYKERGEYLTNLLVTRWPNDPRAADVTMKKAKALEGDGDLLGAIELYEKVEPKSPNYTKARLMIGLDYFNHAQKLVGEKKLDEAKTFYPKVETALKAAIQAIQGHPATFDPDVLKAYDEQEYLATYSLAKLYMNELFGRAKDAGPIVDALEKNSKWVADPKKGPDIQNLRGKLFLSQGKFEEAEKWVDALYKRDPKAAAGPAGQLARAFDEQGAEKRKSGATVESDELWRKAARFYYMSIKPQVDGSMTQNPDEMKEVAERFFVYGLIFNKVPDAKQSFVDWAPGPVKALDYWVKAAEIYEAALTQTPDYRLAIKLGRTYGFLGKPVEAARVYAKLFDQEQVIGKDKRKLDQAATKKGELVYPYLEFGVSERLAFAVDGDKGRLARCRDVIFVPLCNTLKPDSSPEAYWGSRYHLVRTLMDLGEYRDAKLSVEDAQRNVNQAFDEDKYGYKTLFEAAYAELKNKLP